MRFRSTGLGKTELQAEPIGLEPSSDLLILHVQTTQPVRWHIRAGLQRTDMFKLMRLVISPKFISYFLLGFVRRRNLKEPENF